MSFNKADFQPVLPNITDDSMREEDAEIKMVNTQKEKSVPVNKGVENAPNETNSTIGRKIIIGVLLVIIIVLIILLIYQIYKYYTADELIETQSIYTKPPANIDKPPDFVNRPAVDKHPDASDKSAADKQTADKSAVDIVDKKKQYVLDSHVSSGYIPDSVKNIDNNILSQYIQKSDNSSQQRQYTDTARQVGHKNMITDTQSSGNLEMERVSKIIDETRESQETESYSEVDVPSREDTLQQIREDMDDEADRSASLQTIEEEDDVINDFLDDNSSVKSEDEGCQFGLTKGKNRGQVCGRPRVNDTMCSRHQNKL